MPSPTQKDIDYLREHPDFAAKFEAHFGVPAAPLLENREKPTENDIEYLKKHPVVRPKFEARFGDASSYLRPKSNLEQIREQERGLTTAEKMLPGMIQRRAGALAGDIAGEIFDPTNWANAASAVGNVVSRIPEAVFEHPGEIARGAAQGILATPGAINDLALGAVDIGHQVIAGADPLEKEAYAENPFGSATTAGMLEDWGNEATRAAGIGDVFDFQPPPTEAGKTARRLGEFVGAGTVLGGIRGAVPGITGAVGAEAAREVAPDEPGWQAFGGIVGAGAPIAATAAPRGIVGAARGAAAAGAPAARVLSPGGREQIVGNILREASGDFPEPMPMQPSPLPGFEPTLGQATNQPGILQLEKTVAMGTPENVGAFKGRLQESHGVAREAVEALRGGGQPENIRIEADRAAELAQRVADDALGDATTGLGPAQASDVVRGRLEASRKAMRERRQELWKAKDLAGEGALVDVDPLRQGMAEFMSGLPKFFDRKFPKDVEESLAMLNEREPLSELQALRSDLGDKARDAAASNNSKMAMVYGGLRDAVGKRLDKLEFADEGIQAAYKTARNFSRIEAELFKQPGEMRSTLGRGRFGGPETAPADTLRKFIKPGPGGRDTLRQVMAIDDSAEMQNAIGDYMTAQMPQGLAPARQFMQKFGDTLNEPQMHGVRDRLRRVVEARAAQDTLRRSPLNMFTGAEPRVAIKRIMEHPDRLNLVRRLRADLSHNADAWAGMRAAYVDEILRKISSTVERDQTGTAPTVKPGVMNQFYRDNADISREILGPLGEETLQKVADAVEMMTRTSRGGYPGGSPTFSLFSGDRFIDHILEQFIAKESAPAAAAGGATVGATAGSTLGPVGTAVGALGGAAGGIAAQSLFANAKAQIAALLREALLDPKKGRALMLKATKPSLTAIPRAMRPQLEPFLTRRGAAAGAAAAPQTQKNPKSAKPTALRPGQTVSGIMDGQKVTWRYRGGDPKEQSSWDRSPAVQ